MITSPPTQTAPRKPRAGFSLTEVLVATTIGGVLMASVLSSFLFLGKSGTNLGSYAAMEAQARRSLEVFAQDVRQASAITWNSTESVRLVVGTSSVTYELAKRGSDWVFERNGVAVVTGVMPESFQLIGYTVGGDEINPAEYSLAALSAMTKQLQLSLKAARSNPVASNATNTVLSARFILRNKKVT
jgi:prepilin-type N-terminal cleavage/methylation domain-containing protein